MLQRGCSTSVRNGKPPLDPCGVAAYDGQAMDEFGTHTENEALRAVIAAEIDAGGRIPFRRFMELALYHPVHGYYASERPVIGRRGDYLTSPEVSPLFGAMAGRQVAEVWELLGRPDPMTVVEAGPGNGTLAHDLLRWAQRANPELRAALRYIMVEQQPAQRARQQRVLSAEPGVCWRETLPEGITGCILANELLDALPVHVVTTAGGRLRELYVTVDGGAFAEAWDEACPGVARYFACLGVSPAEGSRAEANLEAPAWTAAAAQALHRGLLLCLDYGYPAATLYAPWRRQGTLLCFFRHTANDEALARVGRQDITAHVDFTTIARSGSNAGLALAGFTTQHAWLTALGIHEALRLPAGEAPGEEHFARRRAVAELTEPAGLGRIRALALTRGLDGASLRGFAGAPDPASVLLERWGDDA
jgi:SAM-dependent MidA family methyltransferase